MAFPPRANFEEVFSEIQELLDFTPPLPLAPDPEDSHQDLVDVPCMPFHEQHLPEALSLKAVRVMPSLNKDITGVFEKALAKFEAEKPSMPSISLSSRFPCITDRSPPNCDAGEIARSYIRTTGGFAPDLASTFLLHRKAPSWSTALAWRNREANLSLSCNVFNEDYTLVLRLDDSDTMPPETWGSIEPETAHLLRRYAARNPQLCMLHVFATTPETDRLFKGLDELAHLDEFSLAKPGTIGFPEPQISIEPPKDAQQTPWGVPMAELTTARHRTPPSKFARGSSDGIEPRRRSTRLETTTIQGQYQISSEGRERKLRSAKERAIAVPHCTHVPAPGIPNKATPASVIQHSWYRAIEIDASFIILQSGQSLRIGFRHRHTRTLYLTEDINPRDVTYSRLQVGLFMCILKDAVDREKQIFSGGAFSETISGDRQGRSKDTGGGGLMAPGLGDGSRRKKRSSLTKPYAQVHPRTRSFIARQARREEEMKAIITSSSLRPLLLIQFQEGLLQSPNPSSFLRLGEHIHGGTEVDPSRYMVATLISRIGTGATGDVHNATLTLPGGRGQGIDIVVKLAYDPPQWHRTRHEARIYQHLKGAGVRGIPAFLGVFQDVQTRTMALVMEHVGESVAHQIRRGIRPRKTFSDDERNSFTEILGSIHNAGVRHRDIRPVNLTVNEDGRPFIIDFDRAVQGASHVSRRKELEHLQGLLRGTHEDEPADVPTLSEQDTPLSRRSGY